MKRRFTDGDAAELVDCAVDVARTTATDERGPQPLAICCMVPSLDVVAVPTALRLMDGDGETLCALAASGRTSEGDRRAMVLAAHAMGYRTNFDADGNPRI